MTTINNDNELFNRIAKGDDRAFQLLFNKYFTQLSVYADKILCDTDASIDIVQSLFVSIYEQRKSLSINNIKSFLFQSVHNRCLNELKSRKVRSKYVDHTLQFANESADSVEDAITTSELEARLADAIAQLPPQCRKIFEMSRFEGITNAEIAKQLGISKRTVETQITKALQILRKNLGNLFALFLILYQSLDQ